VSAARSRCRRRGPTGAGRRWRAGCRLKGWPAARLPAAPGRVLTLALTALVALALGRALAAYAGSVRWTRATPNEWLTTAALSFIGAGIILHVGIGLRWSFARKTMQENP
jgi:hypothetical protein